VPQRTRKNAYTDVSSGLERSDIILGLYFKSSEASPAELRAASAPEGMLTPEYQAVWSVAT